MKWLFLALLFITGCAGSAKKGTTPPSVSTTQVIESLEGTKSELKSAGESNTAVAKKIDTALTLAERLEKLLDQIEKDQNKNETK